MSITEVKWEESSRAEYLKGPIRTHWVYVEEDVNSLSKSGKMAIRHFQARLPRLYAPCSAAAHVAPAPTTDRLSKEAAAAAAAAVDDTAAARVGWIQLGSPTSVVRERTPAPLVLRVCRGSFIFTTTATLEELSENEPDRRDGDVPIRATTSLARNSLAAGTELGSGTGGSGGGSGGGCGGPGGGGRWERCPGTR